MPNSLLVLEDDVYFAMYLLVKYTTLAPNLFILTGLKKERESPYLKP